MNRKVLWAANTYWDSPFQVGANHLARQLAQRGWDVAFLSDPVSPLHLLGRPGPTTWGRLRDWAKGGGADLGGDLWHYSPLTLFPPQNRAILRSSWVLDHWGDWTFPNLPAKLRRRGFDEVDLLVVDTVPQHVWTKVVSAKKVVFRMTDRFSQFQKSTPAMQAKEGELARRADLTVFTARDLEPDVKALGPNQTLFLPNGVDYASFQGEFAEPADLEAVPHPRVIYVGALEEWFNATWLAAAARRSPKAHFVVIGPPGPATAPLQGLPNVHLMGVRPHGLLPAYLRHSDCGIIPFDVEGHGGLLHGVNPMKLYEYLAAGLPVVASAWRELERVKSPARLCRTEAQFVQGVRDALARPTPAAKARAFAKKHDWRRRADLFLKTLGF